MFMGADRLDSEAASRPWAVRLREEGIWGLDWLLKTSFGDGYRPEFSGMGMRTDGILGNNLESRNHPHNPPIRIRSENRLNRQALDCRGHSRRPVSVAQRDYGWIPLNLASTSHGHCVTKVTAPSDAEETCAAYLANTPRL